MHLTSFTNKTLTFLTLTLFSFGCSESNDDKPKELKTVVYVAGNESNDFRNVVTLWKDGVAKPITDGSKNAEANSVYVSGKDVYVS
jgi:hypothetical protein